MSAPLGTDKEDLSLLNLLNELTKSVTIITITLIRDHTFKNAINL